MWLVTNNVASRFSALNAVMPKKQFAANPFAASVADSVAFSSMVPTVRFGAREGSIVIPESLTAAASHLVIPKPTNKDRYSTQIPGLTDLSGPPTDLETFFSAKGVSSIKEVLNKSNYIKLRKEALLDQADAYIKAKRKKGDAKLTQEEVENILGPVIRTSMLELGQMGLLGATVPERVKTMFPKETDGYGLLGPVGLQALTQALVQYGDIGLTTSALASIGLYAEPIMALGTQEQIQKYALPILAGEEMGAFALSESGKRGSDPASIETGAYFDKNNDQWVINGSKTWISNGNLAKYILVTARQVNEQGQPIDNDGNVIDTSKKRAILRSFVIERTDKGFSSSDVGEKQGLKSSDTAELTFNEVKIPRDREIGDAKGVEIYRRILTSGRAMVAAMPVGAVEKVLPEVIQYVKDINTDHFGQPQVDLATVVTLKEVAKVFNQQAARLNGEITEQTQIKDHEFLRFVQNAASTKLFSTEQLYKVMDTLQQNGGGNFYVKAYPPHIVEELADRRVTRIYEGTSAIQRNLVPQMYMAQQGNPLTFYMSLAAKINAPVSTIFDFSEKAVNLAFEKVLRTAKSKELNSSDDVFQSKENIQHLTAPTAEIITWNEALKAFAAHVKRLQDAGLATDDDKAQLTIAAHEAQKHIVQALQDMQMDPDRYSKDLSTVDKTMPDLNKAIKTVVNSL